MTTLHRLPCVKLTLGLMLLSGLAVNAQAADPWLNDLQPLPKQAWSFERSQHLHERAGFGATPQEIEQLAKLTPAQAVRRLVRYQATPDKFKPFEDSGSHDAGLEPFAASRPAATDLAKATGQALGVKVKPAGNRQVQQVADRYLYWLRASRLETHRLGYWWANRMLTSPRPFQEAARAFTGWNYQGLTFVINPAQHDDEQQLGKLLRDSDYNIAVFMETVLLSKDFYSEATVATRINPPVELLISTYRKMGLTTVPGLPDFNQQSKMLEQKLFYPHNVAGWAHGRSWINPGLLLAQGNVIYDTVNPPIDFVAPDRVPNGLYQITSVADQLAQGQDITTATKLVGKNMGEMSMFNQGDRDEDFNTRLANYNAWRKAIENVKPIDHYGQAPSLTTLNREGNVLHTVDFRRVYATLMEEWMGTNSQSLLHGKFEPLSVFAA